MAKAKYLGMTALDAVDDAQIGTGARAPAALESVPTPPGVSALHGLAWRPAGEDAHGRQYLLNGMVVLLRVGEGFGQRPKVVPNIFCVDGYPS